MRKLLKKNLSISLRTKTRLLKETMKLTTLYMQFLSITTYLMNRAYSVAHK